MRIRDGINTLVSEAPPEFQLALGLIHGSRERFCDGGIVSNSPGLLGYAEAVHHLGQAPQNISILSLATPRSNHAERPSALKWAQRKLARGLWGWDLGQRIIELTIDSGAMVDDSALKRIAAAAGAQYCRIVLDRPDGLGLDVATPEATETLKQIGVENASRADVHDSLRLFFSSTKEEPTNG